MSRLFHRGLLWGDFLEILSFLSINEVYKGCGCSSRAGFIAFLRERATRQCPAHSVSPSRFLSSGLEQQKVLLVSYPRSGNSFLRKLLECSLGVVTGSDSRPNRTLAESLLRCGFKGEGIIDDSVWVVKTHYPERMGYLKFKAKRIVLLIRNPFDAIESYFHMGMTNTHQKHLSLEAFESLDHIWKPFVMNEIDVWCRFHNYWMEVAEHLCVLPIRYEDLLTNQQDTLRTVTAFMMEDRPPLGIKRYAPHSLPSVRTTGYKPKGGGIGKGLRLLDDTMIRDIVARAGGLLDLYGYKVHFQEDSIYNDKSNDKNDDKNVDKDQIEKKIADSQGSADKSHNMIIPDSSPSSFSRSTSSQPSSSSATPLINSIISSSSSSTVRTSARTIEITPLTPVTPTEWRDVFMEVKHQEGGNDNQHSNSSRSNSNSADGDSSRDNNSGNNMNNNIYSDSNCPPTPPIPPLPPLITLDPTHPSDPKHPAQSFLMINEVFSVRSPGDRFGRGITELRREHTDNDTRPFETMK